MRGLVPALTLALLMGTQRQPAGMAELLIDPATLEVGGQLTITVILPEDVSDVSFPGDIEDDAFVVTGWHDLVVAGRAARRYDAVACTPGDHRVGPLRLTRRSGRPGVTTPERAVVIESVTGKGARPDVQPLMGPVIPSNGSSGWPVALALGGLGIGVGLGVLTYRRRRRRHARHAEIPAASIDLAAILEELTAMMACKEARSRAFYRRLGWIVRALAGERLGVSAREMTGYEVLAATAELEEPWPQRLAELLEVVERGGFARLSPLEHETLGALDGIRELTSATLERVARGQGHA